MADPRYLEAWRKGSVPTPTSVGRKEDKYKGLKTTAYQVRLDTPGGITYAPDPLSQHNSAKRLFVPYSEATEFDFFGEARKRREEGKAKAKGEFVIGEAEDEVGDHLSDGDEGKREKRTEAQLYASTIDLNPKFIQHSDEATGGDADLGEGKKEEEEVERPTGSNPGSSREVEGRGSIGDFDRASILTNQTANSQRSVSSRMTALTLSAKDQGGLLPGVVRSNMSITSSKIPPSVSGIDRANHPWNSTTRTSHRSLDRPSQREKQSGRLEFLDRNSVGRVPGPGEVDLEPDFAKENGVAQEAKSILSSRASVLTTDTSASTVRITGRKGGGQHLKVEDVFLPDPRGWRPLRYVRKVDPRQLLLLCAGATLTPAEVEAYKVAASGATSALSSTSDYKSLAQSFGSSENTDLRAGLGFVFCPSKDPRAILPSPRSDVFDDGSDGEKTSIKTRRTARSTTTTSTTASRISEFYGGGERVDANFSRRLERPAQFNRTTKRRAALRSVTAALEYNRWEEEGFDNIVIATHHEWIVTGISNDIWEWRWNDWKLTKQCQLGSPGEDVPDRDLWELLDKLVKDYEKIE
ncbi:hypothetical protein IE53DRAFT_388898 [Violaceomyces palustris]|uniref:Uncharacterized protein n=1 Tax=Violaceomyces palustris TaxID=1673888 RepID=A0ACD0NT20_9BASI|nr:hypothetical protein IE53DRAFT_388898 [Violaceomyces palustris]